MHDGMHYDLIQINPAGYLIFVVLFVSRDFEVGSK